MKDGVDRRGLQGSWGSYRPGVGPAGAGSSVASAEDWMLRGTGLPAGASAAGAVSYSAHRTARSASSARASTLRLGLAATGCVHQRSGWSPQLQELVAVVPPGNGHEYFAHGPAVSAKCGAALLDRVAAIARWARTARPARFVLCGPRVPSSRNVAILNRDGLNVPTPTRSDTETSPGSKPLNLVLYTRTTPSNDWWRCIRRGRGCAVARVKPSASRSTALCDLRSMPLSGRRVRYTNSV